MNHEHISWCTGQHDDQGNCEQTTDIELDPTALILAAKPCSDGVIKMWVAEAFIYDVAELDRLIEALTAMRATFETTLAETDCDQHEHPEEEDDD